MTALTPERIEALKRTHGELYCIEVAPEEGTEGEPLVFLLKKPTRQTMSAAGRFAQSDPMQAAAVMVENCLVEGPKEALDDLTVFSAVSEQFDALTAPRKATLKKL